MKLRALNWFCATVEFYRGFWVKFAPLCSNLDVAIRECLAAHQKVRIYVLTQSLQGAFW
jgi:hypothetical protein